jgi:hypothetical protein
MKSRWVEESGERKVEQLQKATGKGIDDVEVGEVERRGASGEREGGELSRNATSVKEVDGETAYLGDGEVGIDAGGCGRLMSSVSSSADC